MLRHDDECVQFITSGSALAIKSLQEKPDVGFDDE